MLWYYLPGHSLYSSPTRSNRLPTRSTRLPTRSTPLSTRSTCLSIRSTRSTICRSFYNWSFFTVYFKSNFTDFIKTYLRKDIRVCLRFWISKSVLSTVYYKTHFYTRKRRFTDLPYSFSFKICLKNTWVYVLFCLSIAIMKHFQVDSGIKFHTISKFCYKYQLF